jgi:hypothetical protein
MVLIAKMTQDAERREISSTRPRVGTVEVKVP